MSVRVVSHAAVSFKSQAVQPPRKLGGAAATALLVVGAVFFVIELCFADHGHRFDADHHQRGGTACIKRRSACRPAI